MIAYCADCDNLIRSLADTYIRSETISMELVTGPRWEHLTGGPADHRARA